LKPDVLKPDVLKPDVLKSDVLKSDVLKPDVLWVYPAIGLCFKRIPDPLINQSRDPDLRMDFYLKKVPAPLVNQKPGPGPVLSSFLSSY
jgi:hypothetical protein